jgi:hypothetical protein
MMELRTVLRRTMSNSDMRLPATLRPLIALAAAALAGCASVATEVTVFDPAQKFAPTENAVILLDYPSQPYLKIALIEAHGGVGGSETPLLEEARKRAQALGADAVVRLEVTAVYQPPVRVYDPAYTNMFYSRYRYPYRSFNYPPYAFSPYPYDNYRWVGGGNVQTLKAVAIKYTDTGARPAAP